MTTSMFMEIKDWHQHVRFPEVVGLEQDEEFFELKLNMQPWKKIRFHDYEEIYRYSGLYEHLFYDRLGCNSPFVVSQLLKNAVLSDGARTDSLRVLDLGAGNGMVAQELSRIGVGHIVGVDRIEEAKYAAMRDRPSVYRGYFVGDVRRLDHTTKSWFCHQKLNALTVVAALGFGDIPSEAFLAALGIIETGGWIAYNIRESFLEQHHQSGFATLIDQLICDRQIEVCGSARYVHRRSLAGDEIIYVATVAKKRKLIDPVSLQGLLEKELSLDRTAISPKMNET